MNAMTPIDPASGSLTMSSREIAELTGKTHYNVCRDIRLMLEDLGSVPLKFEGYYTASNGKRNPCFNLPKDLTITLVAGYRADLRHRIVTRWLELEEEKQSTALALPDFSNPAAAARAWADEVEAKEKAQALIEYANEEIKLLSPKASAYDRFLSSNGTFTVTTCAKALGIRSAQELHKRLSEKKMIYAVRGYPSKRILRWEIRANWVDTGVFHMRFGKDKKGKARGQLRVTPRGFDTIREELGISTSAVDMGALGAA